MTKYQAKGISANSSREVYGFLAWEKDRSKYYLVHHLGGKFKENIHKEEVLVETVRIKEGVPNCFLFRGKSRKTLSFTQGFYLMDQEHRNGYIGSFGEKGEWIIEEVYPSSVGIFLGFKDVRGRNVFSQSKAIFNHPTTQIKGTIVEFDTPHS